VFTDIGAALTAVYVGSVAWGDYDNDGDLDILLTGWESFAGVAQVYRNDGGGVFTNIAAGLPPFNNSSVAWGDYDNDGDLDVLLTGHTGSAGVSKVFRNDGSTPNTVPGAPSNLATAVDGLEATLSWTAASDAQTPTTGLTYNVRLGTSAGADDIAPPMAAADGYRRIPALGNMQHGTTALIRSLSPGTYYWSVQAVDTAFAGSPFADEGSFVVEPCAYAIDPASVALAAAGGTGSVALTTGAGCSWTAVSNDAWITVTGGASGTNDGTVSYSVDVNLAGPRTGTITIAGQTFTVNQAAVTCSYSIDPTGVSAPAEGATGTVSVTTGGWCNWSAVSNDAWVTVTGGASGTGSGMVSYSVAANSAGARTGTVTIAGQTFTVNQAELQLLSIDNVSVTEGNASTTPAMFIVTLSAPSTQTVTVHYTTIDGEAIAPGDYTAVSGDLTFAPGDISQPITVLVQGDVLDEIDEHFTVQLSSPVNALIGQGLGTGTITDDDPTPSLSIDDVSVVEGHSGTTLATFTVTLSAPSGRSVGVAWATVDQTAVAPGDYTSAFGPLAFAPGETTKQVSVEVVGDTDDEDNETFLVTLSDPTNAVIGDGEGVGTILDDENALMQAAALTLTPLSQGVLKAGDTVEVQPSWRNDGAGATADMTGSATASNGGTVVDDAASYGVVAIGATASCVGESDCYSVTASGPRPANHWDVKLNETLSEAASHEWLLHVGDSFDDVPRTSSYFRFIETLYHHSVTGGCAAMTYCPGNSTTRAQMSVFALIGKEGAAYSPVACGATPMFADVAVTSPYCKWVEELARRGVVGGCGGGNYCPTNPVTRGQMAIFMLKTLDPTLDPPACGTPMFGDVPASSPYCKWVEELARRGVVSGCGGGNYCPANPVTRGQMGVFISATFGLTLYGP
jgi:hypothetical protein